jgi:hypothetical protein
MGASDMAQAALFADILDGETAVLREQLRDAERRWRERRGRSGDEIETPVRLVRLREQFDEATRLSASLRDLRHKTAGPQRGHRDKLRIV